MNGDNRLNGLSLDNTANAGTDAPGGADARDTTGATATPGEAQGGPEYLTLGDVLDTGPSPIPPKWGGTAGPQQASGSAAGAASGRAAGAAPGGSSAPYGGPPTPGGGAWAWVPAGMEPKKPWRKRHPVLFWGGFLLLLAAVFSFGRYGAKETPLSGPKIAVIKLEGMIIDSKKLVNFIDEVREDSSFVGAVVRIDSPGGGVGPSQEIYAALKRLDASKPLVASMGSLAASGGYYAALGAREIYAGPSTVTASIGVKLQIPNLQGLMKTVGISETTLTTGKLKDAGSSWREMTPAEESYFKALINDMYDEFISTVAKERGLPIQQVRAVADGRAMTGRQALDASLVDKLGDYRDALERVKELCSLPSGAKARIVEGPEEKESYLRDFLGSALRESMREALNTQPVFLY